MLIRFGGIDPARFRDFLAAGKEYSRGDAACLHKKEWIRLLGWPCSSRALSLDVLPICKRDEVNAAVLCFLRCEECLFQRTVPQESRRIGHLTDRVLLRLGRNSARGGVFPPFLEVVSPEYAIYARGMGKL